MECWLVRLGFPLDYQEEDYYQDAIGSFGKFLLWQEEDRRLIRVIIRARVIDLQSVLHFIVFSKSEGFESDSKTVQCEILQHNLLGGGPPDEDLVPELPVGDGSPFAFFRLRQPGVGPVQQMQEPEQGPEQDQGQNPGGQQPQDQNWVNQPIGQANLWNGAWDPWPQPQQQPQQALAIQDLNMQPMEIDLNNLALQ